MTRSGNVKAQLRGAFMTGSLQYNRAMAVSTLPDLRAIRSQFPALDSETIFFENAGGSQVPQCVAEAMRNYMLTSYVQPGVQYPESHRATENVTQAHAFMNRLVNGEGIGQVILGPSTSQLCRTLADAYSEILKPGDEVVICETAHESNAGPWSSLERFGIQVKVWRIDSQTCQCSLEKLADLLTDRTRIVAFPHVSNVLGEVVDVKAISDLAHEAGALVVVDGVAYASHRAMDVRAWGCDWYGFSNYKVYGPHMATLFGRDEALSELTGPNHFFIAKGDLPNKFELGGVNHEGCAGVRALGSYLQFLGRSTVSNEINHHLDRLAIERAFDMMWACEEPIQKKMLDYLRAKEGVRVIGPKTAGKERVPTISFIHNRLKPSEIVSKVTDEKIAIRHGHVYSVRLMQALDLDTEEGVARISMVHYNTVEEVARLIDVLDRLL